MLPIFTTQEGEAAPLGKVELDLEGAPFLEPEPEEDPNAGELVGQAKQSFEEDEEGQPKKSRKKIFIIFGIILLFIIILGVAATYFLLFRNDGRDLDPNLPVVVIPSTPPGLDPAPINKFNISWEPFWVEVADPEGEIRFVYCKILLVTDNQRIALQVSNKGAAMRDAVYYYLRHKPYSFLADLRQLDVLKTEILNIINYYIIPETVIPADLPVGEAPPPGTPKERLREVLIEEYLIK